jgi:hypothetical protein
VTVLALLHSRPRVRVVPAGDVCVCRHEHIRAGSDCGTCGRWVCPRFRSARGLLGALGRLVALLADPGVSPAGDFAPMVEEPGGPLDDGPRWTWMYGEG